MKKIIPIIVLALILLFSGCVEEPTGDVIKKNINKTQTNYSAELTKYVKANVSGETKASLTQKEIPYLKQKTENGIKIEEQIFVDAKTKNNEINFPINGVRYILSFSPAIEFSSEPLNVFWFHEAAKLIPLNSSNMTIEQNGKTFNLKNFNSYNKSKELNTEIITENGKLKQIIIYNTKATTIEKLALYK